MFLLVILGPGMFWGLIREFIWNYGLSCDVWVMASCFVYVANIYLEGKRTKAGNEQTE